MKRSTLLKAKNICLTLATVGYLFLVTGDTKNHILSGVTFVLIISGIGFSIFADRKK